MQGRSSSDHLKAVLRVGGGDLSGGPVPRAGQAATLRALVTRDAALLP